MSKESVLKGISESGYFALKGILVFFFIVGIIINAFLGLIIVAKLYDIETALLLTKYIRIIFNSILYTGGLIFIVIFLAEFLSSLLKSNEKFKEKKKIEFEGFVKGIIDKSRRKK